MRLNSLLTVLFVGTMTLVGCGGGGGTTETSNQAPIADAGVDQTIQVNQTVTITGSGSDVDGTIVSYQWKEGITIVGTTDSFNYTPTTTGIHTLTLTVTDNDGATGSDMMNVTVIEVDNTPPVFTSDTQYSTPENKRYTTSDILAQDISEIYYAITGGEDGSKFAIDSYDATLMFKEFPDYDIAGDTDGDNIYQTTITATDTQGNNASQDITVTLNDIDESIPKTYQVQSLPNGTTTLQLGNTPKDVYLLFTNKDSTNPSTPSVTHNKYIDKVSKSVFTSQIETLSLPKIIRNPNYIKEFYSQVKTLFVTEESGQLQAKSISTDIVQKSEDIAGMQQIFYLNTNTSQTTVATARKVISNISTVFGNKTLNIWVSDDSFGSGCSKSRCVTQDMVEALANTFLKTGLNNDIYDWGTNIYEVEWGSDASAIYSNLIPEDNEITILITDIDNDDSPDGGVVGFFWPKDNYKSSSISGSNERVMFYIDAVMFANGVDTWDINDFWPKELISTLAHEFQHMIHFYQKTILLAGDVTDTWISEMLSESVEDLIATKIQHIGPRGVDYLDGSAGLPNNPYGRYPLFNANNTLSLTSWNSLLADYSKVNAFGTYLLRNYGGEKILHDIMHNAYLDEQAVMDAVNKTNQGSGKTFDDLIHEWGISVLLSDHIDAQRNQYSYNTNDFTVSLKDQTIYKMGSINFFNYSPPPSIETSMSAIAPQGNYYYEVVTNQTGDFNITITKDVNVVVSAVIKE